MKLKIGQKVLMKVANAKWHLDHPEIYHSDLALDAEYEPETLLHLVCALGEPVYGIIYRVSDFPDTYFVNFRVGRMSAQYYIDRKDVTVVKNSAS